MLLATALIGSIVNRESCTISFNVIFADYVYLYDVCDSENKLLNYLLKLDINNDSVNNFN